ncbi:CHASE3 domain-containing protein [Lichenihabitans psoromatis]|uniref:CHASE3 domain-containing protein n=1 Tax=Lichenihabitans psoromatis TaxID=2528642 RepID=UPI0010383A3A|nr:CHASE3 domain-containing protein [Lichenihabitans psoromatis]
MPNSFGLNRSLGGAIGAIALVSLLSSLALYMTQTQQNEAIDARGRSRQIMSSLDAFRVAMLNQETGLRGYLLTGDDSSLEPYRSGRIELDQTLVDLQRLVTENRTETDLLVQAQDAARHWQTDIGEPAVHQMAVSATRDEAVGIEMKGDGKRLFDQFRTRLKAIQDSEEQIFAHQNAVVEAAKHNSLLVLVVGAIITLLICAGMGIAINRLIVQPLVLLAQVMRRLTHRDLDVVVPSIKQRNEVGEMARAVEVFKKGLIELDRTSLLRVTADTLPAMVGYVDNKRRVGFLNGEFSRTFDLGQGDVSEVYGKPLIDVFGSTPFPGARLELETALGGKDTRFEQRLFRPGRPSRDIEAFYRPHRAPNGTVLGVVTLLTDITDRKRMERRLAQQARDLLRSNEELEQFAYVASHDLKAPLRGIENLVSWIEEDLEGVLTGDTQTNMDLLKSRVRRLESLLDDLLAYSRAGRADDQSDAVDTRLVVEELAALVSPPEGFEITADPSLPKLQTPRAPLTQVFQNLIGNAIKHHDRPSVGHVMVAAAPGEGVTEFTITDDGPGIPDRFFDRVFGMFQTLKPRDEVEGSGMGLAIVKKLIERRGGKVWLSGGEAGRGLKVHFTWPEIALGKHDDTDR